VRALAIDNPDVTIVRFESARIAFVRAYFAYLFTGLSRSLLSAALSLSLSLSLSLVILYTILCCYNCRTK